MRYRLLAFALLALSACHPAAADDDDRKGLPNFRESGGVWGLDPKATAANLARDGWRFLSMSTLSWPDGRQAVVTMWQSKVGDYARCFDYFTPAMEPAGGKCERSGTGI
jgi:hypothetical protein